MSYRPLIFTELAEIQATTLSRYPATVPYQVPEGYFDGLVDEVMARLYLQGIPSLSAPYTVPAGYFEELPAIALLSVTADSNNNELATTSPLLAGLSRQVPYATPAGYFDRLSVSPAEAEKKAPVITLRIARKWMQYAAAAVFTGVLVTGAFVFTDQDPMSGEAHVKTEQIDLPSNIIDQELDKFTAEDLVGFLNNPEHAAPVPANTPLASEAELRDVKTHVKNATDEELNQYLRDSGESFDTTTGAKSE
jgi:hypothetical protein